MREHPGLEHLRRQAKELLRRFAAELAQGAAEVKAVGAVGEYDHQVSGDFGDKSVSLPVLMTLRRAQAAQILHAARPL